MHWTDPGSRCAGFASFALLLLSAQAQTTSNPSAQSPQPQAVQLPQPSGIPSVPALASAPAQPKFVVVLDAAHGGENQGARITDQLIEKDIVLALSVRLRSTLSAHGIDVITTRESDTNVPVSARAGIANHAQAAACVLIHATSTGSGVHLFTSSLAPAPGIRFLPWQTAQAAYVTQSLKLSSDIDSALAHADIPVTLGRTSLQPMDTFACPAVAVEIAPLNPGHANKALSLSDPSYQKSIVDALTAALEQWRNDWRQQ
jgi:N-acetylmuramoyl-L-alanine amidase